MVSRRTDKLLHKITHHTNLEQPYNQYITGYKYPQQDVEKLGTTIQMKYRNRYVPNSLTDLDRQLDIYIGQKTMASVASSAQVRVQSILDNYVSAEEIKDFKNVQASYDPTNPKQLNISFSFIPLFEIKWVHVTIGKVLS